MVMWTISIIGYNITSSASNFKKKIEVVNNIASCSSASMHIYYKYANLLKYKNSWKIMNFAIAFLYTGLYIERRSTL